MYSIGETLTFSNPECTTQTLSRGLYFIQLWGGQGGNCNTSIPYGGHTHGLVYVETSTDFRFCVGGKGEVGSGQNIFVSGGFNGGGKGKTGTDEYCCGGGGGGSTDIKYGTDYNTLLMVAGGGGGDGSYDVVYPGGKGGGHNGLNGTGRNNFGKGATATSRGEGGHYDGDKNYEPCDAENTENNIGGNACASAQASAGGGGGGYFGGGGGADLAGGGGGSGYFSSLVKNGVTTIGDHPGNGLIIISKLERIANHFTSTCHKLSISLIIVVIILFLK